MKLHLRTHPRARAAERGFSMIEVLVTLLIISLALLGTAGLQAYSMRLNQSGQFRSQAVFLVADLAERMEANRAQAVAGAYVLAQSSVPNAPDLTCNNGTCTPAQMVNFDLSQWQNAVSVTLPQSSWAVAQTVVGNPSTYTITISWVDRRADVTSVATFDDAPNLGFNATGTGERFFYTATRAVFN